MTSYRISHSWYSLSVIYLQIRKQDEENVRMYQRYLREGCGSMAIAQTASEGCDRSAFGCRLAMLSSEASEQTEAD